MKQVIFEDLGKIVYADAWAYQQKLLDEVVGIKLHNRDNPDTLQAIKHYFLFCEHPHVFTLGKSGSPENLLLDEAGLKEKQAEYYKINRGGDITYHGPNQIVGYPIWDLECFFTDIHKFVRYIEEGIIRVLADFGVVAGRIDGYSGVWLWDNDDATDNPRKICAVGIHLSRWVSMHGFAFNIGTDLSYFNYIVPCGITDKGVTSLEKELGTTVNMAAVKERILYHYAQLFEIEWIKEKSSEV